MLRPERRQRTAYNAANPLRHLRCTEQYRVSYSG
jgi:hypothetical protein